MVRQAARDAPIVADGFSCKHQIKEMTDREALHTFQLLQMALHDGPEGPSAGYPEMRHPDLGLEPGRARALARTGGSPRRRGAALRRRGVSPGPAEWSRGG